MASWNPWQPIGDDEPPWRCDRCGDGTDANMVNLDTEEAVCTFHFESEAR